MQSIINTSQVFITTHPTITNFALSGLFGIMPDVLDKVNKKIIQKCLNVKRYSFYETWIYPLISMYFYWKSVNYFSLLEFTGHSFIKSFFKNLNRAYQFSYSLSLITFCIGYPTINLFFNMGMRKLVTYSLSSVGIDDYSNSKSFVQDFIKTCQQLNTSLTNNDNWDIVFMGASIKTFSVPKPIINMETLNKKCPLRCNGMNNKSESQFLESCAVCIEELDNNKLHRELPCKHVFHPECVDQWLLKSDGRCPMCKQSF